MNSLKENLQPAKRFSTQELAHIEIYGRTGRVLSKMANLSETGALFEVMDGHHSFKNGDLARFTVRLRSINKIHVVDCEVVWSKGTSVGVVFLRKDKMQDKLTQFVFSKKAS